jgi:hypothetical protein
MEEALKNLDSGTILADAAQGKMILDKASYLKTHVEHVELKEDLLIMEYREYSSVIVNSIEKIWDRIENSPVVSGKHERRKADEENKGTELQGHGKYQRGTEKDPAAQYHAALVQVKKRYGVSATANPLHQSNEIKTNFVDGTCAWILKEQKEQNSPYPSWKRCDSKFLLIHGPPGCGKSNIAYFAIQNLQEEPDTAKDSEAMKPLVAFFYFRDEHEGLRSLHIALRSMVVQIAQRRQEYSLKVWSCIKQNQIDVDLQSLWRKLFLDIFPKDSKKSDAPLYLIFDGLDEADTDEREQLFKLLQQASKENANIQVLLTGRSEVKSAFTGLGILELEVTKKKLRPDMHRLIQKRYSFYSRLGRFDQKQKNNITKVLIHRADGKDHIPWTISLLT